MKQTDFAKTLTSYLADFLPGQRNVSPNTINHIATLLSNFVFMKDEQRIRPEKFLCW